MKNISLENNHNFIISQNTSILKEVVSASVGIGSGVETYPLCDYIMQSVFIKMTGAQEQKMKIITWLLATNDYDYRYLRFTQKRLGECSTYQDKNIIYQDLIKQIEEHSPDFNLKTYINKTEILKKTTFSINNIFKNSNLEIWAQKSFNEYEKIWKNITIKHFANNETNLFTSMKNEIDLKDIYQNNLYRNRNKIAHNTHSYQQNLPTLKTLINENYKYNNYFVFFAILILIDNIFIELYNKYIEVFENV